MEKKINSLELAKFIGKILESKKGEDIVILELKGLTTLTDYFIIVSGNSTTHLKTLAKEVIKKVKKKYRLIPLNPYEETEERWILIDYQDCILHIFSPETRNYYNLEDLWFEAKRVDLNLNEKK